MKNLLKELSPTLAYITPKFIDGEEAPAKITPFNIKTLAYNEGPTVSTCLHSSSPCFDYFIIHSIDYFISSRHLFVIMQKFQIVSMSI